MVGLSSFLRRPASRSNEDVFIYFTAARTDAGGGRNHCQSDLKEQMDGKATSEGSFTYHIPWISGCELCLLKTKVRIGFLGHSNW